MRALCRYKIILTISKQDGQMKLQEGQGLSRSMVYDAIAHLAWRHGVVFQEEYMVFPEYADETTRIFYYNISRIVTTRLYVGILQKNGYLYVFMRDSSRKIFIDLHTDPKDEAGVEALSPAQISENISRELAKIIERHTNGAE